MSIPYKGELINRAKELRKNMTKQEKRLWYGYLSKYHIRFQRQKSINSFIADFYCHEAKLIIEVDGAQHYTEQGMAYDNERTAVLNKYGLEVLRFTNFDVDNNFEGVCVAIDKKVKERMKR